MKRRLLIPIVLLVVGVLWPGEMQAAIRKIPVVAPTGQTLYYTIEYYYEYYSDAVLDSCDGSASGDLVIPETITYQGHTIPVTSIGFGVFWGGSGLTSVTIPNSVTSIGSYAFSDCRGLTSVTIPSSVRIIGTRAFYGCTGICSVEIPSSVTSIGDYAFGGVRTISYNGSYSDGSPWGALYRMTNTSYIEDNLIYTNSQKTYLVACCRQATGDVVIPSTVNAIGIGAFSGCAGLTSITIPSSVTSIDNNAFYGCTGLTSVTIPNSVTSIRPYTFDSCTGLTSVTIPNSVTSIGYGAFYHCTGLTSVTIPNSVTSIGNYAFYYCTGLTNVTIPNSVTSIGDNAFYECTGLTSVYYSGDVAGWCGISFGVYLGNPLSYAHNLYINNTLVTDLVIPNGVTEIKQNAFRGATCLASVSIPNSVTSIGDNAFYNCYNICSLSVPAFVTTIGTNAFYMVRNLTYSGTASGRPWGALGGISGFDDGGIVYKDPTKTYIVGCCTYVTGDVVIPSTVDTIGDNAFSNCTGITSITIGNSVTSIGSYAFSDCRGLTSVTIGNSVTSIGRYAFSGCTGLTTVNFNATNCQNMVYRYYSQVYPAFMNIPLTTLNIGDNVANIPACAFYGCGDLTSITIPESVTSIGDSAFYGCTGLTNVTIPSSVTSIGNNAFYGCTGLETVNFNATNCTTMGSFSKRVFVRCNSLTTLNIGGNVTKIPAYAFWDCAGLTSVTIPNSVTSIGAYAFSGTRLTSITIPNSVTSIGNYAFSGTGLTTVNFNATNCTYMGEVQTSSWYSNSFYNPFGGWSASESSNINATTNSIRNINIGSNVQTIPAYAFYGCTGVCSVAVPSSVTNIGSLAFYGVRTISYNGSYSSGSPWGATHRMTNTSYTEDNLIYTNSQKTYLVACCTQGIGDVVIPSTVITIGPNAFRNCTGLTSVTIPNSVTTINTGAFRGCTGLTSVTIPNSVTSIGEYAFSGCTGLTTVNFNATNCTTMGSSSKHVFYGCNSLTTLNIGDNVTNIPAYAFKDCRYLTSVTIPESVTSIGEYAFYFCVGLTSVTIGNSVTSVGNNAFAGCTGIETVNFNAANITSGGSVFKGCSSITTLNIGDNVNVIPDSAFYSCYRITGELTIPNATRTIGNYAFAGCDGLTGLSMGDSVETIGNGAFYNCFNMTGELRIPNTTTTIGDWAFGWCEGISSVNIGYGVQSIGSYAFAYLSACSITIPPYVTTIGNYAFHFIKAITYNGSASGRPWGAFCGNGGYSEGDLIYKDPTKTYLVGCCPQVTGDIVVPESVDTIGGGAFAFCRGINSVTMPNTVRYIGGSAFNSCYSLTNAVLSDNIPYINGQTFYYCTSLPSITIPSSVTEIGSQAFQNCKSLTSVTIPDSVTYIGEYAFKNCKSLPSVTIPGSVTFIGSQAFYDCSGLTEIYSQNSTAPTLSTDAFAGVTSTIPVYIPCGSYDSYSSRWSYFQNFEESYVHSFSAVSNNEQMGTVQITTEPTCYTPAVVEAYPNTGYRFDHWQDGNTENPRTVTVSSDTVMTAYFAVVEYTLTVTSNNTAMGTASGGGSYAAGATVTLTATANSGYHFTRWQDNNTQNPRTVTVTGNATYTAYFEANAPTNYTLTVVSNDPAMGTAAGGGTYASGTTVTITATANTGYHFTQWQDGNTQSSRTVTVTGNATYTAYFEANAPTNYTLTVVSNDPAMGSAAGGGTYASGTTVTITATANTGYHFTQWQDGNTQPSRSVTVTADATYTAYFAANAANEYTITVMSQNPAMGTTTGSGTYSYGTTTTITAEPNSGFYFVQWQDGNTDRIRAITVTGDATYTAYFDGNSGIDDIDRENLSIYARGNEIVVEGAGSEEVIVYDVMGRIIYRGRERRTVAVPSAGVYMVKVGDYPSKKVVVYR